VSSAGTKCPIKLWARSTLCGGLAFWLALFPVAQAVHLALADHDHCLCPEHRQIEDVPRRAYLASEADPEHAVRSPAARAARIFGLADLLMSFSLHDSLSKRVQASWVPFDVFLQYLAPRPADRPRSLSHLLVAPKTSPPCLAA
jgi:hypothetical protein